MGEILIIEARDRGETEARRRDASRRPRDRGVETEATTLQNTCFCDSYVLFGVRTKNVIISTIFRQKTRNSLFPQCKTSIGNNSDSVKDRVVKFAYSMGLSAIADLIV